MQNLFNSILYPDGNIIELIAPVRFAMPSITYESKQMIQPGPKTAWIIARPIIISLKITIRICISADHEFA